MTSYAGDVLMSNTADGGEITFVNGQPVMTGGFETAAFLCLFGGNFDDDGLEGNKKTWWANLNENIPHRRYISRFQNLVRRVPLITGNLRRFEEAAKSDLDGFKAEGIADAIEVEATIPRRNFLKLVIDIKSPTGENSQTEFLINWQAFALENK